MLLQSALVCPLLVDDRCIGTLSLYHVDLGFFLDDHRRLLDRVSEQASAVINNALVFEQTQEDSLTDALTGLPNTRFLYMHLSRELARAGRLEAEVAVMLMDLDGFKEINDTHGHHVGDRALVDVARTLRAGIRPYDICVRYAGDEFIVVLPGCSMEEAEVKRTELQRSIGDLAFDARPGLRLQLGISVGIAVFSRDGESVRNAARHRRQPDVPGQGRAKAATVARDDRPAECRRLIRAPSASPASGARPRRRGSSGSISRARRSATSRARPLSSACPGSPAPFPTRSPPHPKRPRSTAGSSS